LQTSGSLTLVVDLGRPSLATPPTNRLSNASGSSLPAGKSELWPSFLVPLSIFTKFKRVGIDCGQHLGRFKEDASLVRELSLPNLLPSIGENAGIAGDP